MSRRQRIEPGPGQESVWDYPRPPTWEESRRRVRVVVDEHLLVDAPHSFRVLETSHPPTHYVPRQFVRMDCLVPARHGSFCEWKGRAHYFTIRLPGRVIENAAWCYPDPSPEFARIAGCLAFYPSRVDACYLDDERVQAQAGDFYGGWISSQIVGPFKGGPGTMGW